MKTEEIYLHAIEMAKQALTQAAAELINTNGEPIRINRAVKLSKYDLSLDCYDEFDFFIETLSFEEGRPFIRYREATPRDTWGNDWKDDGSWKPYFRPDERFSDFLRDLALEDIAEVVRAAASALPEEIPSPKEPIAKPRIEEGPDGKTILVIHNLLLYREAERKFGVTWCRSSHFERQCEVKLTFDDLERAAFAFFRGKYHCLKVTLPVKKGKPLCWHIAESPEDITRLCGFKIRYRITKPDDDE